MRQMLHMSRDRAVGTAMRATTGIEVSSAPAESDSTTRPCCAFKGETTALRPHCEEDGRFVEEEAVRARSKSVVPPRAAGGVVVCEGLGMARTKAWRAPLDARRHVVHRLPLDPSSIIIVVVT